MKKLKLYQEKAVDKLLSRTNEYINEKENQTIVFQAPTGSGKTFMITKYIEALINETTTDLCFVWVSIGKGDLHKQSYKSVKRELSEKIECTVLEDDYFGSKVNINQNEILFLNWEKIRAKDSKTNEWKNVIMKDRETLNFIDVLQNTRTLNRQIILIIDESHSSANSERATEIRDTIVKPNLTIEMSATPIFSNADTRITVNYNDVIQEGMIKNEVLINPDIETIVDDVNDSQELILEAALRKRIDLLDKYKKVNSIVNPLILIQLPNGAAGDEIKDSVISFLRDKGITEESGKVAIWLTDEKINNEADKLLKIDGRVEVLIFKQAIDTGWDCPRSQILVRFRESTSITFEIQTVGRILRMPEAKHYDHEELNSAYVFTNIQSILVKKEEYNPNIIKTNYAKRSNDYKNIELTSFYKKRIDFGDVTSSYYSVFEKYFCEEFDIDLEGIPNYYDNHEKLKQKGVTFDFENMDQVISNEIISTDKIDQMNESITSDMISINYNPMDLQIKYENIIKENLNGFAPRRSMSTIKQATFYTFKKHMNLNTARGGVIYIQNIIVKNSEIFSKIYDLSLKTYKKIHEYEVNQKNEWKINNKFEIPISKSFNSETTKKIDSNLSVIKPLYVTLGLNNEINSLEKEFIDYIESKNEFINWFWQNGAEHMESNLGIKVSSNKTFQPDFIISFKNGYIGIFDTKATDYNVSDTKEKAEALQYYIKEENHNKNKKLMGGIIIKDGPHFRFNDNKTYNNFTTHPEDWKYLDELF